MSVQTVHSASSVTTPVTDAPQAQSAVAEVPGQASGYWEDPADQGPIADLNQNPIHAADDGGTHGVRPNPDDGARPDAATQIDGGSSNPGQRTQGTTPDGKAIAIDPLHQNGQVSIARERTLSESQHVLNDQLVLTTGSSNDNVEVSQRDDGTLAVAVNGETYDLSMAEGQELTFRTGAGNDTITVAPNVKVNIVVAGGDGDDHISTGGGDDRIDGGRGNDVIAGGEGRNDLFGNSGDDRIVGGNGANIIYGGDGADELVGGNGVNYIDGGSGNDSVSSSGRHDMLIGGRGDDTIDATGQSSTVYAGEGRDSTRANAGATVYMEASDLLRSVAANTKPTVVNVEIDPRLGSSIRVEGSESFRQRIASELDFLRSSSSGRAMLAEFDQAAQVKGNSVTIRELANEQNGYAQTLGRGDAEIRNGRPGAGGDVIISYNPSFHMDEFPAPMVVLFHEMSHAYNGVNGTFLPGTYQGTGPDSGRVPNAERQAVGLESSAPAYDFDGDPSTPPTTHNPIQLTENGLRTELGLELRPSYAL